MSLSLSAIDQAKRPDFVPTLRRDDEGDRGFSDMLRDSVDRVREVVMPERRVTPRVQGERAVPTAREAREVGEASTRQARRVNDPGKSDAANKTGLTDVTQAKREIAARPEEVSGVDEAGSASDLSPMPKPVVVKTGMAEKVDAAAKPVEIPVVTVADEAIPVAIDANGTLIPIVVALPQPTALPIAQGASQDGGSLLAGSALPPIAIGTDVPVSAPIGFADLVASTAPISSIPIQNEAPTATTAAATPVPGFAPAAAPGAASAAAPAPTPNAAILDVVTDAVAVTTTVVATVVAPVIAQPAPSAPSAPAVAASAVATGDAEGSAENPNGLPAGVTVTVTNQAQVLATKPVRIDGPLIVEQPDTAASEATAPAPLPAETAELPVDSAELPAAKLALPAGAPVASNPAPGMTDDGLSQPLATGAVSTGAAQPDVTAAAQPTVTQAVAATVSGTAEPTQAAVEVEAPVATTEPAAATNTHASSHASTTAQANAADQARFNRADAATRNAMPQHVADQVAVHIAKAIKGGDDNIKINLRPESLGQVEVQLKIAADGRVKAVVQVDKPETMELMQRDARGLERALQDAGLKTDSGSLSFNLRGHDQQREHARNEFSGNGGAGGVDVVAPEDEISAVEAMVALSRANGGIDVRV